MMKYFLSAIMVITGLLVSGCAGEPVPPGTLQGKVTIGPIVPVERPGVITPVPCEVYQARKIMVYDENGSKLVAQVDIGCDGNYRVELKPDVYTVDINRIGIDHSKDLPGKIEIKPGETVNLDVDIDTGIR